jgi:DNA repair photolyase
VTITRQIEAKSILSKSGIDGITYCVNPYVGCSHGCVYCYASFMKRFTGHREPWGSFVDVKVNAPRLLEKQTKRAVAGTIILSSVTDPYQPAEARYRVTRGCLEVLAGKRFPVDILTKSPLVLRDLDLFKTFDNLSVGITVTTDNDAMRKIFEPGAPPIKARIEALKRLHKNGISTYAFIGPVLPMDPEVLADRVRPHVDRVLFDGMNYPSKTKAVYRKQMLDEWLDGYFVDGVIERLRHAFGSIDVECC